MSPDTGPDHFEEQPRAAAAKFLRRLTDRSERNGEQGSELEIVESYHGNLTRNRDPPLTQSLQHAQGVTLFKTKIANGEFVRLDLG